MGNLYQIRKQVVISSMEGGLPTDAEVCLPVSCLIFGIGASFYVQTENGKTNEGNCFFVEADITYKVMPLECKKFVIIFFDAISSEHYFLSTKFNDAKAIKLDWEVNEEILNKAFSKMNEKESNNFLNEIFIALFNTDRNSISHQFDDRIILIDEHIRENIRGKINNKELAAKIHLSESRFYHFFKEQTHVNVSRYILWLRLKTIFDRYFKAEGKLNALLDLTNFTDLSHFIKAFKSFFGESPKRLLNK